MLPSGEARLAGQTDRCDDRWPMPGLTGSGFRQGKVRGDFENSVKVFCPHWGGGRSDLGVLREAGVSFIASRPLALDY